MRVLACFTATCWCLKFRSSNFQEIEREFPLMAAVNRAANNVKNHQARLIWLEYNPKGPCDQTIMLVGKG